MEGGYLSEPDFTVGRISWSVGNAEFSVKYRKGVEIFELGKGIVFQEELSPDGKYLSVYMVMEGLYSDLLNAVYDDGRNHMLLNPYYIHVILEGGCKWTEIFIRPLPSLIGQAKYASVQLAHNYNWIKMTLSAKALQFLHRQNVSASGSQAGEPFHHGSPFPGEWWSRWAILTFLLISGPTDIMAWGARELLGLRATWYVIFTIWVLLE